MSMPFFRILIGFFFWLISGLIAFAQDETALQLMQTVQSSLVEVRTVDTKTFNENNGHIVTGSYHTQGSGVIIDSNGLIVTNTHIVAGSPHIYVGLSDGKILEATLVYSSDADFSFIKVDPPYPLDSISWADSAQAQIGTSVIAISSNGDDNQQHVLGGEITNLINGASSNQVEAFELNFNLYHGDSGGPLLDNQGQLLGLIMGKKLDVENKSYAIASNKIQQEYLQYKQNPLTN